MYDSGNSLCGVHFHVSHIIVEFGHMIIYYSMEITCAGGKGGSLSPELPFSDDRLSVLQVILSSSSYTTHGILELLGIHILSFF